MYRHKLERMDHRPQTVLRNKPSRMKDEIEKHRRRLLSAIPRPRNNQDDDAKTVKFKLAWR